MGWVEFNLVLYFLFQPISILPHELGHAFMGWLVGLRVFRIVVGAGRTAVKWKLGKTLLEFKPVPMGGYTIVGPRSATHLGGRMFLMALGGPLVNALLIVAAIHLAPRERLSVSGAVTGLQPHLTFVLANVITLVWNLIPRKVKTPFGPRDSDGGALLRSFSWPEERRINSLASTFALEGWLCLEELRYADALSWYEKGLQEHPQVRILLNERAIALLGLERFEEARAGFLEVLSDPLLTPTVRAIALNNVAVADLYLIPTRPELLEEANRHSEQAHRMFGWMPLTQGTRGAVLIELGRLEEGVALARQAFEGNEVPRSRAYNACTLAIGLHLLGRSDEARNQLRIAQALHPECLLLPRAQRMLEGKPAPHA